MPSDRKWNNSTAAWVCTGLYNTQGGPKEVRTILCLLTLSLTILLRLYTLPYWSNPPFLTSDIQVLWHSGLSAKVPECQKLRMVG